MKFNTNLYSWPNALYHIIIICYGTTDAATMYLLATNCYAVLRLTYARYMLIQQWMYYSINVFWNCCYTTNQTSLWYIKTFQISRIKSNTCIKILNNNSYSALSNSIPYNVRHQQRTDLYLYVDEWIRFNLTSGAN